jgi:hypothetical protein
MSGGDVRGRRRLLGNVDSPPRSSLQQGAERASRNARQRAGLVKRLGWHPVLVLPASRVRQRLPPFAQTFPTLRTAPQSYSANIEQPEAAPLTFRRRRPPNLRWCDVPDRPAGSGAPAGDDACSRALQPDGCHRHHGGRVGSEGGPDGRHRHAIGAEPSPSHRVRRVPAPRKAELGARATVCSGGGRVGQSISGRCCARYAARPRARRR